MPVELVLGVKATDIDSVADAVHAQCGRIYKRHDSLYLGEYNLFTLPESLMIKYNFVESEDEWEYPQFKQLNILLIAGSTDRPEYFRTLSAAAGISFTEIQCKSL